MSMVKWQTKFSSKNKLMLAQFQATTYIYIYIYIKKKKKKPYQATRSNSKRYNQLEKK